MTEQELRDLIAKIRTWQAAAARYDEACEEARQINDGKHYPSSPERRAAIKVLDAAALDLIHDVHNDVVLEAFVALADIVEPALKLAEQVKAGELPISGVKTHDFSLGGWPIGWIDEDVKKGAYTGFLGALIELVNAVEIDKERK